MKCPYCAEEIKPEARICRFCRTDLATGGPAGGAPQQTVKAKSGVSDGVKLGCGMFIVLPLIILGLIIFFLLFLVGLAA